MADGSGMVKESASSEWLVPISCRYLACQVLWVIPQIIGLLRRRLGPNNPVRRAKPTLCASTAAKNFLIAGKK